MRLAGTSSDVQPRAGTLRALPTVPYEEKRSRIVWRKCVGIEPTIPRANPGSSDLKSVEATRPQSLPVASYQSFLQSRRARAT